MNLLSRWRPFDPSPPPGLHRDDFQKIAANGFGDLYNAYPHSMAWFKEHLYVGVTRANMCMLKASKIPTRLPFWPVDCPDNLYDLDMRAQIWRYNPIIGEWREVYRSPMITALDGSPIPRDMGYRGMAVFQGQSDPEPALYVSTYASARGPGAMVLRSIDGEAFSPVSKPGLLELPITSIRTLTPFKGRLLTSPTGRAGGSPNAADIAVIYENRDPLKGQWTPVNIEGFGDPGNAVVFEMAEFGDYFYAGTGNFRGGYQIWRTRAKGRPPYDWELVVTQGAQRGAFNQLAMSMVEFKGALYVGSGIQNGGIDLVNKIGPAAPELIRIHPDGRWDLLIGHARQTPQGLKTPLSGCRPGFGNGFNGYFWRMAVHEGWLYLATLDWSLMLYFSNQENWPPGFRRIVNRIGLDQIMERQAGGDLYRSFDGENWLPVTTNGFDNRYNYGIRGLVSTAYGLFAGAANPFGPRVAVRTEEGWAYQDNPHSGLEIWLGSKQGKQHA
ncbi:MAG: hypothetical protein H6974_00635 [Gammaproteobacteria bacterium]|nr:hypothetical protein [Gammaproteobacteria bacterium]MCP5195301.1 hypothetical protein [Gammaproteobacteria bacterium]